MRKSQLPGKKKEVGKVGNIWCTKLYCCVSQEEQPEDTSEDEATPSKTRIIPSPPVSVPEVQDVTHKIQYEPYSGDWCDYM